jgi:hypothetical protein
MTDEQNKIHSVAWVEEELRTHPAFVGLKASLVSRGLDPETYVPEKPDLVIARHEGRIAWATFHNLNEASIRVRRGEQTLGEFKDRLESVAVDELGSLTIMTCDDYDCKELETFAAAQGQRKNFYVTELWPPLPQKLFADWSNGRNQLRDSAQASSRLSQAPG